MRTSFRIPAVAATAVAGAALSLTGAGAAHAEVITNTPNFVTVTGNEVTLHVDGPDIFDNYCTAYYGPQNVVDLWAEQKTGVRTLSAAEQSVINDSLIDGAAGQVKFGYVSRYDWTVTPLDAYDQPAKAGGTAIVVCKVNRNGDFLLVRETPTPGAGGGTGGTDSPVLPGTGAISTGSLDGLGAAGAGTGSASSMS